MGVLLFEKNINDDKKWIRIGASPNFIRLYKRMGIDLPVFIKETTKWMENLNICGIYIGVQGSQSPSVRMEIIFRDDSPDEKTL